MKIAQTENKRFLEEKGFEKGKETFFEKVAFPFFNLAVQENLPCGKIIFSLRFEALFRSENRQDLRA